MCVCVCARERASEGEREGGREREREGGRERERERDRFCTMFLVVKPFSCVLISVHRIHCVADSFLLRGIIPILPQGLFLLRCLQMRHTAAQIRVSLFFFSFFALVRSLVTATRSTHRFHAHKQPTISLDREILWGGCALPVPQIQTTEGVGCFSGSRLFGWHVNKVRPFPVATRMLRLVVAMRHRREGETTRAVLILGSATAHLFVSACDKNE